jgi:hypothetical protein
VKMISVAQKISMIKEHCQDQWQAYNKLRGKKD